MDRIEYSTEPSSCLEHPDILSTLLLVFLRVFAVHRYGWLLEAGKKGGA